MSKTFEWTDARDRALRMHFMRSGSAGELATKWGVSRNTICGRKFRLGIQGGKIEMSRPMTDHEIATIVAMRRDGKKVREIAVAINRPAQSIFNRLSDMGLVRLSA
jgi:hypothetical protein